jgi:hypothetical protein
MSNHKIGDMVMGLNNNREVIIGAIRKVIDRDNKEPAYKIWWCDGEDLDEWYYEQEVTLFKERLKEELGKSR